MIDWKGWDAMKWLNLSKHAPSWRMECRVLRWRQSRRYPRLKSRGVVMVVEDEFKSQPCKTIWYTNGERMEGLRCCELLGPVQTHTILVRKVDRCKSNFDPISPAPQKHVVATILRPTYQSQPSSTIHHNMMTDWKGCDAMKWLNRSNHAPSWCGM